MGNGSPEFLHEQPDRDTVRVRAAALPKVEGGDVIDEVHASALIHDLEALNPELPDHIRAQIDHVLEEVEDRLDSGPEPDTFTVTHQQLRGAVARGVIRGVAQTALDVGEQFHFDIELKKLLGAPGESTA